MYNMLDCSSAAHHALFAESARAIYQQKIGLLKAIQADHGPVSSTLSEIGRFPDLYTFTKLANRAKRYSGDVLEQPFRCTNLLICSEAEYVLSVKHSAHSGRVFWHLYYSIQAPRVIVSFACSSPAEAHNTLLTLFSREDAHKTIQIKKLTTGLQ